MQIIIGREYINKTWKFLRPCLKFHGSTFKAKYSSVRKLAVGIHDCLLDGANLKGRPLIYILIDTKYKPRNFEGFMDWIKNQEYYVMDYAFDDMAKGRKHMVVLELPKNCEPAYIKFLEGKYSEMYDRATLDFLSFSPAAKAILLRTEEAKETFAEKVNVSFKLETEKDKIKASDLEDAELDFPWRESKEYFNHGEG